MRRLDRGPHKRGGLVGAGIRGIAGGIGLVSESIKAHSESKRAKTQEEEHGSVSRASSEGKDNPDRDFDASNDPPPSYSLEPDSKTAHDQHPDEKAGCGQYQNEDGDYSQHPIEDDGDGPEDGLEDEWNLDDAQDEIIGEPPQEGPLHNTDELETMFLRNHPPPKYVANAPTNRLPLPVVLPQRRPKDRSRGFIRAYAPVLETCGIDQATWLAFLDTFQKSSAANPWLNAINMASIGTLFMPLPIGMIVSYAIRQTTNVAIELQTRERTTGFLHKINEDFFRPRGLYCLVMTWNPESAKRVEQVNLTATIASRSNPATGLRGLQSNYRTSDGNTYGEWEFPEVAPLIFPALDQLAAQTSTDGVKEKTKMAKGMTFVANYWDKRATTEYGMKNPDSVLARVPQEEFHSRYADPNHPAASGSLISFVSGGHLVPSPHSRGLVGGIVSVVGQAVRGEPQGSGWNQYENQQYQNRYSRDYRGMSRRRGRDSSSRRTGPISTPMGAYKKLLKKNVLYLMVVNMPSDEEMAAAKTAFQL